MAQLSTQETTGMTRIKGPFGVTLRGAESEGHDFTFTGPNGSVGPVGTGLDVACRLQAPSAQTANIFQIEKPDSGNAGRTSAVPGNILFWIDCNGNIVQSGVQNVTSVVTQVTLTAANLIAMNGTPVSLLPAPGAGKVIMGNSIWFQMKPTATQFTGGGVVTCVYHGGSVNPHSSSIAAAVVNSASASNNQFPPIATAIQPPTNTGIDITNATAAFATGTGTAVVTISYDIVTLS